MSDLVELNQIAERVEQLSKTCKWEYMGYIAANHCPPGPNACLSIALRILTLRHGKFQHSPTPKTSLKEFRPWYNHLDPENVTDPERYRCIYIDFGIQLVYTHPAYPASPQKVTISSAREFTEEDQHCAFYRNEGHLRGVFESKDFRKLLIDEFGLEKEFERLQDEFQAVRDEAWKLAIPMMEKHANKQEKIVAKRKSEAFLKKRSDSFRKKAQDKLSGELLRGMLKSSFKNYTPEEFFEMYQMVEKQFHAIEAIYKWQGRNPAASKEVTIEDIKIAYELASVKEVMEA